MLTVDSAAAVEALAGRAAEAEALGRLPDANVRLLKQLGIPRRLVPKRWGGDEALFSEVVDQVMELARGCVSTGWCAGLFAEHPWIVAHLGQAAQQEVWSAGPDVIVSMSFNPSHPATSVPNGFRLNGHWFFTSGCDHAEWFLFVAPVAHQPAGPAADVRVFLVPAPDVSIDHASWRVSGLRGTGSKTVSLEDVFVPEHRSFDFLAASAGQAPGLTPDSPAQLRQPLRASLGSALAASAVGAAQAALELFTDRTRSRTMRLTQAAQAIDPSAQTDIAEATVLIETARLLLLSTCALVHDAGRQARQLDTVEHARIRLQQAHVVRLAVAAVDRLFADSGGGALQESNPLQRLWRDVHAVHAHVAFNWGNHARNYGSIMVGQGPTHEQL